ncbi:hypothetical protein J31TS4_36880 [Paenibacillus sp. J31TS4]|uniref:DoxX family protein n=1 Tax=Paenibacillus sp. J31TS4 TaxID=2807195 RepID=UPI001B22BCB7|nr:DoxX family protein [Paenibacillus sp. J31TS4]GIP40408.1 hypothetical protein J31TS4_36880 [Paenibacillus sp. J31TS4]
MNNRYEWSLLVIRVMLGLTFVVHGYVKVTGMEGTVGFFESLGLPGALAYVVAALELVGGLLLIAGLFTRLLSLLLGLVMLGATLKVKLAGGFLGSGQGAGYELDLALLAMAAALAISGSKFYALDSLLPGRKRS